MPAPQKHHLLPLLLAVSLLSGWSADGARNDSRAEVAAPPGWMASVPSSRDIVVREGASTLIECNVTGSHDDIKWYNSRGPLLGEGGARRRKQLYLLPNLFLFYCHCRCLFDSCQNAADIKS